MVDEALNRQDMDQKLNALNQRMAVNVATLEKLVTASTWTTESIKDQGTRLLAVENTLDDVRHRQLSKLCGDIATVQDGVSHLEARCTDVLDEVNLRVDELLARLDDQDSRLGRLENMGTSRSTSPAPVATSATDGLSPSHVPPTGNPRASPDYAQPAQSSHGHRSDMAGFSSTGEFQGMRISVHAPSVISATSISPPNCYRGQQDTRNERAQLNPVRYLPGMSRPPQLDVDPSSDEDGDNTQGGPIFSPRHWDRTRLTQKMGISP